MSDRRPLIALIIAVVLIIAGAAAWEYFGVEEVMVNLPASVPYPTENLFLWKKRQ